MIRFSCPKCSQIIKASDERIGAKVMCPRCTHALRVPHQSTVFGNGVPRTQLAGPGSPPPPSPMFPPMGLLVKLVVHLLGSLTLTSLILVLTIWFGGFTEEQHPQVITVGRWSMRILCLGGLALLVALYGHGTSCPSCGWWWSKQDTGKELIDNAVSYKLPGGKSAAAQSSNHQAAEPEGIPYVKATYQWNHRCKHCGHEWFTFSIDEYKKPPGRRFLEEKQTLEDE